MAGLDKDLCGVTGKERHATKEEAKEILGRYAHERGSRKVYRCVFCDSYHLTKGARGKKFGRH